MWIDGSIKYHKINYSSYKNLIPIADQGVEMTMLVNYFLPVIVLRLVTTQVKIMYLHRVGKQYWTYRETEGFRLEDQHAIYADRKAGNDIILEWKFSILKKVRKHCIVFVNKERNFSFQWNFRGHINTIDFCCFRYN